ncbi:MAG: hypothetical protein A2X94_09320 [Bdellovibrionales bacterium GWB1_55_8]|nr:MAG: hypothetical protein A2X94_09320 [Bdellovibrionales bacterium GWB1_55_8]
MPSGWDVYYVVFLSAFLALAIPCALWIGSAFFKQRSGVLASESESSPRTDDGFVNKKVNARFFLAANASLTLIALALALIPCVGTLADADRGGFAGGFISVLVISGLAALGLLYAARKGDLSWLRTYQQDLEREARSLRVEPEAETLEDSK